MYSINDISVVSFWVTRCERPVFAPSTMCTLRSSDTRQVLPTPYTPLPLLLGLRPCASVQIRSYYSTDPPLSLSLTSDPSTRPRARVPLKM